MLPEIDLSKKTVVLGMGNLANGDDGVGTYITDRLTPTPTIIPISAGTTPENKTSQIREAAPDQILLIDAALFDAKPGTAKIISKSAIKNRTYSTHQPTELLLKFLETIAPVQVLGIQPKSRESISPEVKATADSIIQELNASGPDRI